MEYAKKANAITLETNSHRPIIVARVEKVEGVIDLLVSRSIKHYMVLAIIVCRDHLDPRPSERFEFHTALFIGLGKGRTKLLVMRSPSLVRSFLLLTSQLEVVKIKTRRTHVQLSW